MNHPDPLPELIQDYDVGVAGGGLSGLCTAIACADRGLRVAVFTSAPRERGAESPLSNSELYKGGTTYQPDPLPADWPEPLVEDILEAGCYRNHRGYVQALARDGARAVDELLVRRLGVSFTRRPDGGYDLGLEAGYRRTGPCIVHVEDHTGESVMSKLEQAVAAHPHITLFLETEAIEVLTLSHHSRDPMDAYAPLTCVGFYVLDHRHRTITRFLPRRACVLATGGAAGAFANTSNVDTAIGSGIALVHRRGGRVRAVHAVQFHPTGLAWPLRILGRRELVTEKVRGDGAIFTDQFGSPIPELRGTELQPRDQVARALYTYIKKEGRFVFLDLRQELTADRIREKFPKLLSICQGLGLDITAVPIPVEPVAHYHNGGVWVDPQTLETSIGRLYALGEVKNLAHGYNRLASTSTRECVYDAWLIAPVLAALSELPDASDRILPWQPEGNKEPAEQLLWNYECRIKEILWNWVGIVRAEEELKTAVKELTSIQEIVQTLYFKTRVTPQVILVRNLIIVALLMATGALGERESCGCHYRVD